MSMDKLLIIGVGGFFGAVARYVVSNWAATALGLRLNVPIGTLLVNVTGSLILGILFALMTAYIARGTQFPDNLRLFLGTGFCGAYTTFSTYAVETVTLARGEQWSSALVNIVVNNMLCLAAVVVGIVIVERIVG